MTIQISFFILAGYKSDVFLDFGSGPNVGTELLVLFLQELVDLVVGDHHPAHSPGLPSVDLGLLGVLVGHILPPRLVLEQIL